MRAIDLFAGAGGFTTGAEQAGVRVVWAANHWPVAVETHRHNHPATQHECQDLRQADWTGLPAYDLLMASPSCRGHSRARGKDRPHHDAERATAWAVVDCAEATLPLALLVENVPEFQSWALFDVWKMALSRLGYSLSEQVLCASGFGAAQERERVFIAGVRGKRAPDLVSPNMKPVAARDLIQWGAGSWSPVIRNGRARNTLRKIEASRALLGDRFLLPYYGNTKIGRSLDRPIGTITAKDRYALVDGDRMRMITVDEYRAGMGFPADYHLAGNREDQVRQLGNAVHVAAARGVVAQLKEVA